MKKESELRDLERLKAKFQEAYSIHGRGVGKLELDKAIKSQEFRKAAKKLVRKIHDSYPPKANVGG